MIRPLLLPLLLALALLGARALAPLLPDDGQIAFVSNRAGEDDIFLIDVRSGIEVNLTRGAARGAAPAWSPDGRALTYASQQAAQTLLMQHSLPAGRARPLAGIPAAARAPAWSPEGARLAFENDGLGIYDLAAERTDTVLLLNVSSPEWTRDGQSLLVTFVWLGGWTQIGRYDIASGGLVAITPPGRHYFSPDFSPDGRWIVAAGSPVAIYADELFLLEAACLPGCASAARQLTTSRSSVAQPDWSPTGTHVAYNCFDGSNYEICILDVARDVVRQITHTPGGVGNFTPAWRP